jgi:hypothetical protein
MLVGGTLTLLLSCWFFACMFTNQFLWLLGAKYQNRASECVWVCAAACVGQLGGVLWALNSNKAWIRFQTIAYIPTIALAQAATAYFLDLREFHNVLLFYVITAAAPLPIYLVDAYWGLKGKLSVRVAGNPEQPVDRKLRMANG